MKIEQPKKFLVGIIGGGNRPITKYASCMTDAVGKVLADPYLRGRVSYIDQLFPNGDRLVYHFARQNQQPSKGSKYHVKEEVCN